MAIVVTDRGTTEAGPTTGTSAVTTTSASFTPAASSVLTVPVTSRCSVVSANAVLSDTFGDTGGTAWVKRVENSADGATFISIWTRQVGTGAASGAVTVGASTDITTSSSRYVIATFTESSGVSTPVPPQTQNGHNSASPLTITLAATPATTSVVFTNATFGNGTSPMTKPTGYTTLDLRLQANGDAWGSAYLVGNAAAAATWSSATGTSNEACSVELTATATPGGGPVSPFRIAPDARTRRRMAYVVPAAEIPTPLAPVLQQPSFLVAPDARTRRRLGLPALVFVDPTTPAPPPPPDFGAALPLVAPDAQTRRRLGLNPLVFVDPTTPAPPPPPVLQQATFLVAPDARTRRRFGLAPLVFTDPTTPPAPPPPVTQQSTFLTAPDAATRRRLRQPGPPLAGDPSSFASFVNITGTMAVTLAAFVMAASGASGASGSMATTLDAFTMAASGGHGPSGSSAVTLDAFVMAAQGSSVVGTIATTVDPFTMAATGTAGDAPVGGGQYPTIHRHLEQTWQLVTLTHDSTVIAHPNDRRRRNLAALAALGVI